uniref:Transposase n=1 Tax=Plectus sambesii TaxID=2011161 RepID=A0A914XW27_9BILA
MDIHSRKKAVYGDMCLSEGRVYKWLRKFKDGEQDLDDAPWPGQAHHVITPASMVEAERMIEQDRRVIVNALAAALEMSVDSVHHLVHKELGFSKVCACWVP